MKISEMRTKNSDTWITQPVNVAEKGTAKIINSETGMARMPRIGTQRRFAKRVIGETRLK